MSKSIDYATAKPLLDKILAIDLESVEVLSTERLYQKDFAKKVRDFLKSKGFKRGEISVTSATGSMCYWIDIRLPHIDRGFTYRDIERMSGDEAEKYFARGREIEDHRDEARQHLDKVIGRAFPGCKDRSDYMTDYHDFMYTCW